MAQRGPPAHPARELAASCLDPRATSHDLICCVTSLVSLVRLVSHRWARTTAASLPSRCSAADGPPEPQLPAALCGRACVLSSPTVASHKAGASALRAGIVLDVRYTDPITHTGGVCAHVLLAGRTQPNWVQLGGGATQQQQQQHGGAQLYVGGMVLLAPNPSYGGTAWPARVFHLLRPSQSAAAAAAEPASPSGVGGASAISPGKSARGGGTSSPRMPHPSACVEKPVAFDDGPSVLVRFFGEGPEESAIAHVARESLQTFPRLLAEPIVDAVDSALLQARLDALDWLLRNPRHAFAAAGEETDLVCALPPAKQMLMLVGRAVEVLWPLEESWYKGVVQQYDEKTGCHFIVYADGDVEWLALHSGYFAWQLLTGAAEAELRSAISLSRKSRLRNALPGRPLAMTNAGDRLFGPPAECAHCSAPSTRPGGLLTCHRCARSIHASCMRDASEGSIAEAVRASSEGRWTCEQCAVCDACGRTTPAELRGHWPARVCPELQGPWRYDAGRRVLCIGCAGGVKDGGRCASSLRRWPSLSRAQYCTKCSLWSMPPAPANGGATTAAVGKPMRPSPPKP